MAYEDMGWSFMDGVLWIYGEFGLSITKVIVHTWENFEGGTHGGSP
jgi:hypothetical protein